MARVNDNQAKVSRRAASRILCEQPVQAGVDSIVSLVRTLRTELAVLSDKHVSRLVEPPL